MITQTSVGGILLLRISPSCEIGRTLAVSPVGSASVTRTISGTKMGIVAIELKPSAKRFQILVSEGSKYYSIGVQL